MKRIILFLTLCAALTIVYARTGKLDQTFNSATAVAANTTNTTAGAALTFANDQVPNIARISVTASGIGATTNGSLKVVLASSRDGTTFDTGTLSQFYVSMTSLGATTNTVSDWFVVSGVKSLRVERIENTFFGAASNIVVRGDFEIQQ